MNKTITRQTGSFKVISELGKVITIYVNQRFVIDDPFGAEPQEIPTTIILTTSNGRPVNKIDENTYEILGETEKIRVTKV